MRLSSSAAAPHQLCPRARRCRPPAQAMRGRRVALALPAPGGPGPTSTPTKDYSLRSIPELNRLLTEAPDGPAAFAIAAHQRLLSTVQRELARASCTLAPAPTSFSDADGSFLLRSRGDDPTVLHTQTLAGRGGAPAAGGGSPVDWGHQSVAVGAFGAYTKSSVWLATGPHAQTPLTPHLELEIFAPAAAAAGGGGGGDDKPLLFYFSLDPRASLVS